MTDAPPPGWYPNPEGGHGVRWWNGEAWTHHVDTGQAAAPSTWSQPAAPPMGPPGAIPSPAQTWDQPPPPVGPATQPWGHQAGGAPPWAPGLTYANFGQRLGAALIDGLVLLVLLVPPLVVLAIIVAATADPAVFDPNSFDPNTGPNPEDIPVGLLFVVLGFYAMAFAVPILYNTLFEGGAYGQTIGKWAMNISVRHPQGHGPIGRGKALGRALMRMVSAWVIYLGYLWMLWDPEKRTWHDMAPDVRVVVVGDRVPFGALVKSAFRSNAP